MRDSSTQVNLGAPLMDVGVSISSEKPLDLSKPSEGKRKVIEHNMMGGLSIPIGRFAFAVTSLNEATDWIVSFALQNRKDRQGCPVRLSNAYCIALAENNREYAALDASSGITFPDGLPVMWFMRWATRGTQYKPRRVRGPSVFNSVLLQGATTGVRHFLLGASDDTLKRLQQEILRETPEILVSGSYSPPFGPITDAWVDDAVGHISDSPADIIWVALGTPKQDFACSLLAERTGKLCIGVGAAFDFKAGTVKEAPTWMQAVGLEWTFRLISEPRRLWRRYLIGNMQFLVAAVRNRKEARRVALLKPTIDLTGH